MQEKTRARIHVIIKSSAVSVATFAMVAIPFCQGNDLRGFSITYQFT